MFKKSETHGNKSKICKERQDFKTTIFEDLKQGGLVIWVRKVRKVRLEKYCPKNRRPMVIRVRFVRKDKTARQQFFKISNKTTNFADLKQGDEVLWVRKIRSKNEFSNKSLDP